MRFLFRSSAVILLSLTAAALPQGPRYKGGRYARALVTAPLNETERVTLRGNVRPEVNSRNDRGALADSFPLDHMQLQLRRPAELEDQLAATLADLENPTSPNYHHWLTPDQFGERFGTAPADIAKITAWLESFGFHIDSVPANGMFVEFSGSASQVKAAFHTEIHHLDVDGVAHFANISEPEIPASLAAIVVGPHALHNFMPHSMIAHKPGSKPQYSLTDQGQNIYNVAPADLATIYNLNPAFSAGYRGAGQRIVVVEDTTIKTPADIATFRAAFGLAGYAGTFTQYTASGSAATCTSPGVNGDEPEAALDAEWAGAAAPDAAIELAACKSSSTVFGGLVALQNLNASSTPPPIVSMSYGNCEALNTVPSNAAYVTAYQQSAAQGTSVFVASGDQGAAGCDRSAYATRGLAVNGFASTPYNVAVGGTDFADTYAAKMTNGPDPSAYWNAANSSTGGSAISYLPEIPWNESCAGTLLYTYLGYSQAYGASGFCATSAGSNFRQVLASSGGISTVSAAPAFQLNASTPTVTGLPGITHRVLPDVSLFAASYLWRHGYLFCLSDTSQNGTPCIYTAANVTNVYQYLTAGGTSFSSPIVAGMQALVNQYAGGSPQGNPNPHYYALAQQEFGPAGSGPCNASLGPGVASGCIFNDVTLGDTAVNCHTANCFGFTSSADGVLSTSTTTLQPAYPATTGWDYATGLGTLNAWNLIRDWAGVPTTTVVTSSAVPNGGLGQSITFTATVTATIGTVSTGSVSWNIADCPAATPVNNVATCTTSSLPRGSNAVTATFTRPAAATGLTYTLLSSSGTYSQTVLNAQTINFPQPPTIFAAASGNPPYNLAATASSGLPVTFAVISGQASLSGANNATLTITGAGPIVIAASQPGDASSTAAAPSIQRTLTTSVNAIWVLANNTHVAKFGDFGDLQFSAGPSGSTSPTGGIAIDNTLGAWVVDSAVNYLVFTSTDSSFSAAFTAPSLQGPSAVAVDGAGLVWVTNATGNSLSLFAHNGTSLAPSTGYNSAGLNQPSGIAIDLSGDLWITSTTGNRLVEVLGAATPVASPLSLGVTNNTTATRP